jgi:hypothetical protein
MTGERDPQFASDLSKMNDDDVRQQIEPSVQPLSVLRAMAVTELEKRRQIRSDALLTTKLSVGGITLLVVLLVLLIAGIGAGLNWSGYFA